MDTRRDLTFVDDTVDGFLAAAYAENVIGETINLGSGEDIRIGDLAELVINLVGKPLKLQVESARLRPEKSEVNRLLSDNRKAFKLLGWKPAVTLEDGLQITIDWVQKNIHRFQPGIYQV